MEASLRYEKTNTKAKLQKKNARQASRNTPNDLYMMGDSSNIARLDHSLDDCVEKEIDEYLLDKKLSERYDHME